LQDFIANHGIGKAKAVAAVVLAALSEPDSTANGAKATCGSNLVGTRQGMASKKAKALKVSMKGALGGREAQSAYVEAILLLPGVTSVTIDTVCFALLDTLKLTSTPTMFHFSQSKDKIVVYTTEADTVKPKLAGAIRTVRTRFGLIAAGNGRALGPSAAANAYYGDEDEDEAYESSAKNTITDNAGVETVEARMARKRRARAAAKGGENQGIMGAVANVGSWLWG